MSRCNTHLDVNPIELSVMRLRACTCIHAHTPNWSMSAHAAARQTRTKSVATRRGNNSSNASDGKR